MLFRPFTACGSEIQSLHTSQLVAAHQHVSVMQAVYIDPPCVSTMELASLRLHLGWHHVSTDSYGSVNFKEL